MPSRFLNNQRRFVTCDTTQRTGLNFSASVSGCLIWALAQILNGPSELKMKRPCERPLSWRPVSSLWEKPKRRILRQSFRSLRVFRPAKYTYLEWNLLGFMELLVLLRFRTFLSEEKAICGVMSGLRWSGFPANRGLSRRVKNERFAVARRETHKRIASFKETKYDFSL